MKWSWAQASPPTKIEEFKEFCRRHLTEQQIEMVKLLKGSMNTEHYMEEFEQLAVALARKAREIREFSDAQ